MSNRSIWTQLINNNIEGYGDMDQSYRRLMVRLSEEERINIHSNECRSIRNAMYQLSNEMANIYLRNRS